MTTRATIDGRQDLVARISKAFIRRIMTQQRHISIGT
jgi:hypothetical protein